MVSNEFESAIYHVKREDKKLMVTDGVCLDKSPTLAVKMLDELVRVTQTSISKGSTRVDLPVEVISAVIGETTIIVLLQNTDL